MPHDDVLSKLNHWEADESFYRDHYHAMRGGGSLEELLEGVDPTADYVDIALHPENIDPVKVEDIFFMGDANVALIKHPRFLPYFSHKHMFFEMAYVLSGSCKHIIDGKPEILTQGDLCLIAPNVSHGIELNDDSILINILVRYSTFIDIFLNTIRDKSKIALFFLSSLYGKANIRYLLYRTGGDPVIQNYILDMFHEQLRPDEYSDRINCSLLTIFFTQLTRRHGDKVMIPDSVTEKISYADDMLGYILRHYSSVSLSSLAEEFHFSVPYCSKIIKEISGSSFSELLTNIRMQQGMNLLAHTQLSIADISDHVGYKNPETFIRCFSRQYHMTPTQFRREAFART